MSGHWTCSGVVTFHHERAACVLLTSGRYFPPEARGSEQVSSRVLTPVSWVTVAWPAVWDRILRLSVGVVGKNAVI